MKVKGTTILDLVRILRATKEKDFNKYLEPADWDIINDTVMASQWYRGDSYWRIAYAVACVVGEKKLDNLYSFGRLAAKSRIQMFKRIVVPHDPVASLEKYISFWENYYDFEGAEYRKAEIDSGQGRIIVKTYDYPDMTIPEMRAIYAYGLAGAFHEVIEQSLKKKILADINDNNNHFEMIYKWK